MTGLKAKDVTLYVQVVSDRIKSQGRYIVCLGCE